MIVPDIKVSAAKITHNDIAGNLYYKTTNISYD